MVDIVLCEYPLVKQTLLKVRFPPCKGCSGTASPKPSGRGALWAQWQILLPGVTGQAQSQPGMLLQTDRQR